MKSIIVADAEPAIRRALRTILECHECRVIATSSIDDTLTVLSYLKPNLILAEQGLGLEMIKRLQSRNQAISAPVLLITGEKPPKSSQGIEYLQRPFEVRTLMSKVTQLLGSPCPDD